MEFLIELFFQVYIEMMFLIVPEKRKDKKYATIAMIIAVVVFLGIIALAVWGAVLITDYNNLSGIIPLSIAAVISLTQIIAGMVLYRKHH